MRWVNTYGAYLRIFLHYHIYLHFHALRKECEMIFPNWSQKCLEMYLFIYFPKFLFIFESFRTSLVCRNGKYCLKRSVYFLIVSFCFSSLLLSFLFLSPAEICYFRCIWEWKLWRLTIYSCNFMCMNYK